ncbi:PAS-domain containing protein [Roseibium salinum]|nr:PAS-domain containing protein [Roseibium salinum]
MNVARPGIPKVNQCTLFTAIFEPTELLKCLASSVPQGLSIIDKELNLVLVSQTALKLLGISYDLLQEDRSLENVFRFNAKRGDYGPGDPDEQVQQRLELARKFLPHDFVRGRPDGTVLRIQGSPMENGGFITIYTDVTKEHEQEKKPCRSAATT